MSEEGLMPWKETCAVDERGLFISEVLKEELSVAELCRRYGISRKTGHKWIERYEAQGIMGLQDRSHIAHHCPHRLSEVIREQVLNLRIAHPTWGRGRYAPISRCDGRNDVGRRRARQASGLRRPV
jgi:putative transposase